MDKLHYDNDNQGDIPYGTVIALRRQDYETLRNNASLTNRQKAIIDVFRYYGCRIVDGQGQVVNNKAVLLLRTDGRLVDDARSEVNATLQLVLPYLYPVRNPRSHKQETEIWPGDNLPYVSGGGPIDRNSVNNAWDVQKMPIP